jgi:hypothetical protein
MAIYLLNEMRKPWTLEEPFGKRMGNLVCKSLKSKNGAPQKTLNVTVTEQLFNHINKEALAGAVGGSDLVEISPVENTSVIFARKSFRPYAATVTNSFKHILMGSIFLGGKKIIDVKSRDSFFLDYYVGHAELAFFGTLSQENSYISILLWDENLKKTIRYKFLTVNGKIVLHRTENDVKGVKPESSLIKKFRPKKPTSLVFVHKSEEAKLKEVITPEQHIIKVVDKKTFAQAYETSLSEGYSAATLFVGSKQGVEFDKKYNYNLGKLKEKFRVLNVIHVDGKVSRI